MEKKEIIEILSSLHVGDNFKGWKSIDNYFNEIWYEKVITKNKIELNIKRNFNHLYAYNETLWCFKLMIKEYEEKDFSPMKKSLFFISALFFQNLIDFLKKIIRNSKTLNKKIEEIILKNVCCVRRIPLNSEPYFFSKFNELIEYSIRNFLCSPNEKDKKDSFFFLRDLRNRLIHPNSKRAGKIHILTKSFGGFFVSKSEDDFVFGSSFENMNIPETNINMNLFFFVLKEIGNYIKTNKNKISNFFEKKYNEKKCDDENNFYYYKSLNDCINIQIKNENEFNDDIEYIEYLNNEIKNRTAIINIFKEEADEIDWIEKLFKQTIHCEQNKKYVDELRLYLKTNLEKIIKNKIQKMKSADFSFLWKIEESFRKNHSIYNDYDKFDKSHTKYEFEKIFMATYLNFLPNQNHISIKKWKINDLLNEPEAVEIWYDKFRSYSKEDHREVWVIWNIIYFFTKNKPKYITITNDVDNYELFVLFLTEIFMNSKLIKKRI